MNAKQRRVRDRHNAAEVRVKLRLPGGHNRRWPAPDFWFVISVLQTMKELREKMQRDIMALLMPPAGELSKKIPGEWMLDVETGVPFYMDKGRIEAIKATIMKTLEEAELRGDVAFGPRGFTVDVIRADPALREITITGTVNV